MKAIKAVRLPITVTVHSIAGILCRESELQNCLHCHCSSDSPYRGPGRITCTVTVIGKIKWYIKPVLFGGEPELSDNIKWVELDQHAQLVRFWNQKYREIRPGS